MCVENYYYFIMAIINYTIGPLKECYDNNLSLQTVVNLSLSLISFLLPSVTDHHQSPSALPKLATP